MKKIVVAGVLCIVSLLEFGCNETQKPANNGQPEETQVSGACQLYYDNALSAVLSEPFRMYDSAYPQATIEKKALSSRECMALLLGGKARVVITARNYLKDEDSLMQSFKVPKHQKILIAKDAFVFFTAKNSPLDTLNSGEIEKYLQTDSKKGNSLLNGKYTLYSPDQNSTEYAYLSEVLGKRAMKATYTVISNRDSLRAKIRSTPSGIGIGLWSQICRDTTLKPLRIGFADSTGKYHYPRPVHQAHFVMGDYPYVVEIQGYLLEDLKNLPWGFLTYLSRDSKAQAHFNTWGIVPGFAKIVIRDEN